MNRTEHMAKYILIGDETRSHNTCFKRFFKRYIKCQRTMDYNATGHNQIWQGKFALHPPSKKVVVSPLAGMGIKR